MNNTYEFDTAEADQEIGAESPETLEVTQEEFTQWLREMDEEPGWRATADKEMDYADGNQLDTELLAAMKEQGMRRWEADIKQYEASSNISLQTAKINTDVAIQTNNARLEAAKIGLATSAQRVASAWSMVSASAAISGSVSQSV